MFETVRYFRNDIVLGILLALLIALGFYGVKTLIDRPDPLEDAQKVHVASSMRWPQTAPGKPWLAKPQYPEDGASNDERGAKAAMGYFIATFNYVGRGGEIEAISEFSLPDCEFCTGVAEDMKNSKTRGSEEGTMLDYRFENLKYLSNEERRGNGVDVRFYATAYESVDTFQGVERGKLEANDHLKHLGGKENERLVLFDLIYKDRRWWVQDAGSVDRAVMISDLAR